MRNLLLAILAGLSFYLFYQLEETKVDYEMMEEAYIIKLRDKEAVIDSLTEELGTFTSNYAELENTYCDLQEEKNRVNLFWNVISGIESSYGEFVIGDGGKAKGHLHIHAGAVQDVNRIYGTSFTHDDMFDFNKAKIVGSMYLNINTEKYVKYYAELPTASTLARSWNGGFGNINNTCTLTYLSKFNKNYKST